MSQFNESATVNLVKYVPLPNYEELNAKNPGSKVVYEILVTLSKESATIKTGMVTIEAASGAYHSGATNQMTAVVPFDDFFTEKLIESVSVWPYAIVKTVMQISEENRHVSKAIRSLLGASTPVPAGPLKRAA